MSEATRGAKVGLVWVLLVLSAVAVGLTACDVVASAAAAARGADPLRLCMFVLPNLLKSQSRFGSLAAQLALPALALGLPVLALAAALWLRRTERHAPLWAAAATLLFGLGFAGDLVLYGRLAARPRDEAAPRAQERLAEPEGTDAAGEAQPVPPAARPGVEKIVFASDRRGGNWDLWAMNPDGSGQERVSRTERVHMQPRLAPDGTLVTFTSAGEGGRHLVMLMDWATRAEKEVCEGDQSSFTGDGRGLVFRREGRIWRRGLASGEEKRVSPGMWSKCSFPSAAPDGSSAAFAARLLAGYNIYLVPFGGGEPKTLVSGKGTCDPRWSPSGKWLSYQTETHIYMIRPDGKKKYQVTVDAGVQHYATWSPDESSMAYCQGPAPRGPWQIYRISLTDDFAEPEPLTKEGSNIYPDWGRVPAAEESAAPEEPPPPEEPPAAEEAPAEP